MLKRLLFGLVLFGLMVPAMALNFSVELVPDVAKGATVVTPDGHIWTYEIDFGIWDTTVYEYDENFNFVNSSYFSEALLPLYANDELIFETWYSAGTLKIFNTTSGTRTAGISANGGYNYFSDYKELGNNMWVAQTEASKHGSIFHTNGTIYDTVAFPGPVKFTAQSGDMYWAVSVMTSPPGFKIFEYNISGNSFSYQTQRTLNYTIGNGDAGDTSRFASYLRPMIYENYMVVFGRGNQSNTLAHGVYDFSTDTFVSEKNLFVGAIYGQIRSDAVYNEHDQKLYHVGFGDTVGPIFSIIDTTDGSIDYVQTSNPQGVSGDTYDVQPKYSIRLLPVDTGKDVISFILLTNSIDELEKIASDSYYGWTSGLSNNNYVLVQYNGTNFKYENLYQEDNIEFLYTSLLQIKDNSIGNKVLFYRKKMNKLTSATISEDYLVFTFPEGSAFSEVAHLSGYGILDVVNTPTSGVMDVAGEFVDAVPVYVGFSQNAVGDCQGTPAMANITLMNHSYTYVETAWSTLVHSVSCVDDIVWFDVNYTQYNSSTESYGEVIRLNSSYGNNIATHNTWLNLLVCVESHGCYLYLLEGFSQECYAEASFIGPSEVSGVSPPIATNIYAEVIDPIAGCALTDYILSVSVNNVTIGNLSETVSYISTDLDVGEQIINFEILEVPLGPYGEPTKYTSLVNANATINVTEGYQPTYEASDITPIIADTIGGIGAEFSKEESVVALGGMLLLGLLATIFLGFKIIW